MAESTCLVFPHGACGMGNPEVECACVVAVRSVRRVMSRCRSRCWLRQYQYRRGR